MDTSENLPLIRVDKFKGERLSLGTIIKPKFLNTILLGEHFDGTFRAGSTLAAIMVGDTLLIRYPLFTGGYKDTGFTLIGASAAIQQATGLSPLTDEERGLWVRETISLEAYESLLEPAEKACGGDVRCKARVLMCHSEKRPNAEEFEKCID